MTYDPTEQSETTELFASMLAACSRDGGKKLAAGVKVPWQVDQTHEAGLFSHLNKWKHGELVDEDSGAHPLVHAAWRCLAIAWQETCQSCDVSGCEECASSVTVGEAGDIWTCKMHGVQTTVYDHIQEEVRDDA